MLVSILADVHPLGRNYDAEITSGSRTLSLHDTAALPIALHIDAYVSAKL